MSFIGDAVGSIVGGITGSKQAAKGAQKAAATQAAAADAGVAEQRRQFDITQGNLKPFLNAGQAAIAQQMGLIGLNGTGQQQEAITALLASPEATSSIKAAEEAILANASATGGLRGGNTQNALSRYRGDLVSSLINNQYGRLGQIAGQGQATGAQLGQFGANNAATIAQLLGQKGAATAGGQIAAGNQLQNTFAQGLQIAGVVAGF